MIKYLEELEKSYQDVKEESCPPENKLQFIGNYIFDFATYDNEMGI